MCIWHVQLSARDNLPLWRGRVFIVYNTVSIMSLLVHALSQRLNMLLFAVTLAVIQGDARSVPSCAMDRFLTTGIAQPGYHCGYYLYYWALDIHWWC